ncbi:MAG: hypothetical protein MJ229_01395 [bacterium]|nr:hypothetical protein [bacterium]
MTDLRVNNINIASQYSVNNAEQVAQTAESQNSVFETAKVETKQENNKQDANLTNQIKKWYGLNDEAWNKLSKDEKAAKAAIYIQQAVAANNEADKSSTLTVERQYELYLERNTTAEEREILTLLTLNFKDDERQYKLAKMSVADENEELRNAAEKALAGNYHKATVKNQVRFAKDMVKDFSEKNVEIAAANASKTNVKVQEEVVETFLSTNKEKINAIIEAQINQFGIDNEGRINEEIRNACAREIEAAKARVYAKQAAEEVKAQPKIETVITPIVAKTEEVKETKVEEVKEEVEEEVAKSSIEITEEKIENISKLVEEKKEVELKSSITNMNDQEKLALLDENPSIEVINVILNSFPSFLVSCKIQKILNSMNVREISNEVIANADEETQIEKIQQAASQNRLSTINRFCLTAKAKKVYDKIA